MRQTLSVNVVELIGSNYEIGLEQGKRVDRNQQFSLLKMISTNVNSEKAQDVLQESSSGILEEIGGIAEGLDIDYQTAIRMYSGYDFTFPSMGCSAFAQDDFYVRNYDFSPELFDGRIVFHKPKQGYASIGFSQQIVGRLDGMNEHGLVVGLHLVNEKVTGKGLLGTTIVRIILDECRNVEEAVTKIKQLPHGNCYNYSLVDKHGNKCMVEASPEKQLAIFQSTLICANHFEMEELQYNNRPSIDGSVQRKNFLLENASEYYSPEEAYNLFNNENSPLFFKHYRQYFGTLYTVIYHPRTTEVTVGIGGNAGPTTFSFTNWLNGEQHIGGSIIGEIDY